MTRKITHTLAAIENGLANQTIFNRLKELETLKEETQVMLRVEQSGIDFIPSSKEDVAKIYRKSRDILDGDSIQDKRAIINNFVNRIVVYKGRVEVYINLIPTTHCATLDLDILDTHLFSGELKVGEWELENIVPVSDDIADYAKACANPDAQFYFVSPCTHHVDPDGGNYINVTALTVENPLQKDTTMYNDSGAYPSAEFNTNYDLALPFVKEFEPPLAVVLSISASVSASGTLSGFFKPFKSRFVKTTSSL